MPSQAIILAGGRGSRLGPLSAQRSKALVTIGQRPHLIHQLLLLRDADVKETIVVVSPDTERQVTDVVRRAGFGTWEVRVVVQEQPLGPVDALRVGLEVQQHISTGTYVLMSDTFLDEELNLPEFNGDWVGVAPAPSDRSFCYEDHDEFFDGPVEASRLVTVGVNYLASRSHALAAAYLAQRQATGLTSFEVPMSWFFNLYQGRGDGNHAPLPQRRFGTWLDVGDVEALSRAHRTRFISRSHHKLVLDDSGVLLKYGDGGESFTRQADWLLERQTLPGAQANLTPRVFDFAADPANEWGFYAMEYVDLPTLSELWLYWPGRPDVWESLLRNVITQLETNLWTGKPDGEPSANVLWFVDKTRDRLAMRGLPEWHAVAEPLLQLAEEFLRDLPGELVRGHGDLNFSNILYSLNTGAIKLLDPRGDHLVPWFYELAKLRYSYHGGFSAITHGLASFEEAVGAVSLWPQRRGEIAALDRVLGEYADLDVLTVCEGCLLIAGAPLHDGVEADQLFWRGVQLLTEVLKP